MSFSQRVKSISMGKFTPEEVQKCVEGGNEVGECPNAVRCGVCGFALP